MMMVMKMAKCCCCYGFLSRDTFLVFSFTPSLMQCSLKGSLSHNHMNHSYSVVTKQWCQIIISGIFGNDCVVCVLVHTEYM